MARNSLLCWGEQKLLSNNGRVSGSSYAVSSYAVNAVSWAVSRGILQGSNGLLNPSGTATRAEVAAMIMRYAGNR